MEFSGIESQPQGFLFAKDHERVVQMTIRVQCFEPAIIFLRLFWGRLAFTDATLHYLFSCLLKE